MKVAAVQIKVSSSVKKNTQTIIRYLEKAKKQKVDIVCFCETTLHPHQDKPLPVKGAIKEIQQACKDLSIWCIVGAYVPYKKKVKNMTFVINRKGKIIHTYAKKHLWNTEKGKVIPGKSNKVLTTEFGKIAVINCWDFAFPEELRKLSAKGAWVIFCPSYLVSYKKYCHSLTDVPLVRAFENVAYYISADGVSPRTLSESVICHPTKVLKKIKGKPGMITAKLQKKEIDTLRDFFNHV